MRFEFEKRSNLIYISNRSNSVYHYDNITEGDFIEDENKDIIKFQKIKGYSDVYENISYYKWFNSWILVVQFINKINLSKTNIYMNIKIIKN